jgi:hypothetical protein
MALSEIRTPSSSSTSSPTLGDISTELELALSRYEELLDDELPEEREKLIDGLLDMAGDKIDRYCNVMIEYEAKEAMLSAHIDTYEREVKKLKAREHKMLNARKFMESRLMMFLQRHEMDKFDTGRFVIKILSSGGKAPVIVTAPPPEDYLVTKTVVTPDKTKIHAELEAGVDLEFAVLGERKKRLSY